MSVYTYQFNYCQFLSVHTAEFFNDWKKMVIEDHIMIITDFQDSKSSSSKHLTSFILQDLIL